MWERLKTRAGSALIPWALLVLGGLALILYLRFAPKVETRTAPGSLTVAPVVKVVEKVKRITVPGPERIVYLDKSQLAEALRMPELNQIGDGVTSVTSVSPSDGSTTVVGTLSPTGESRILLRQEPPKFFEIRKQFAVQARYLFTGKNIAEADIVASPVRLGPVHLQAGAGIEVRREDSQIGARTFVGFEYKFN